MAISVLPGSRAGYQYATLTADTWNTLTADRDFAVRIVKFYAAVVLDTETIRLHAEGQDLFGGASVQYSLLLDPQQGSLAGNSGSIMWIPTTPLIWNRAFPLKFYPVTQAVSVLVMADAVAA